MEEYRFKVVRTDGSHYFYTYKIGFTIHLAIIHARKISKRKDLSRVDLYKDTKLVATFYH